MGIGASADDLSSSRSNNIREDSHKSLNCRIDSSLHCLRLKTSLLQVKIIVGKEIPEDKYTNCLHVPISGI